MAKTACTLSLPQMIDLAINSPEVGSINFNVVHTVLHVIVQQLNLLNTKVEFRGEDGDRIKSLVSTSKPTPSLNLTEYTVAESKDTKAKTADKSEGTVVVVESTKESKNQAHFTVAIDKKKFDSLENDLIKLRDEVNELKEMPANPELLQAIRNNEGNPVVDMLQLITLSKRIDGVESGLSKMGSMLEDLAKSDNYQATKPRNSQANRRSSSSQSPMPQSTDKGSFTSSKPIGTSESQTDRNSVAKSTQAQKDGIAQGNQVEESGTEKTEVDKETLDEIRNRISTLEEQVKAFEETIVEVKNISTANVDQASSTITDPAFGKKKDSASQVAEGDKKKTHTRSSHTGGKLTANANTSDTQVQIGLLSEKVDVICQTLFGINEETDTLPENKVSHLEECFRSFEVFFANQSEGLTNRLNKVESSNEEIMETIRTSIVGTDGVGFTDMYNKVLTLQDEFNDTCKVVNQLVEDKNQKQLLFDTMTEQVELIKTIKANHEDLEDALADKADTCTVNRKVSHVEFDATCGDLSRGIETMISKLQQREETWEQTLGDIQEEIGSKLDKMDLNPLQEFVTKKIKMLQAKLKALASLKRDTEAAGAKSKFLRNVNCISCDTEVVMRKENDPTLMPPAASLPPTKSMGPYLAYELDALRKQQKCGTNKSTNQLENGKLFKKDHQCNRYCGGSHTLTTPQQRVTRLGHFMQQYGPQTDTFQEGFLKGNNGQMFKASYNPESQEATDFIASVQRTTDLVVQGSTPVPKSSRKDLIR